MHFFIFYNSILAILFPLLALKLRLMSAMISPFLAKILRRAGRMRLPGWDKTDINGGKTSIFYKISCFRITKVKLLHADHSLILTKFHASWFSDIYCRLSCAPFCSITSVKLSRLQCPVAWPFLNWNVKHLQSLFLILNHHVIWAFLPWVPYHHPPGLLLTVGNGK